MESTAALASATSSCSAISRDPASANRSQNQQPKMNWTFKRHTSCWSPRRRSGRSQLLLRSRCRRGCLLLAFRGRGQFWLGVRSEGAGVTIMEALGAFLPTLHDVAPEFSLITATLSAQNRGLSKLLAVTVKHRIHYSLRPS